MHLTQGNMSALDSTSIKTFTTTSLRDLMMERVLLKAHVQPDIYVGDL